jgi:methanethiol S-methyltransferase
VRIDAAQPSAGARMFAWTGALLFFASLSYFLFTYAVTFGETNAERGGLPAEAGSDRPNAAGSTPGNDVAAVAIDVALFGIFALHHSIFARERIRAWVARVVPPRLERAAYVWAASLLFILVCAAWQPLPGTAWRLAGVWRWLGYLAQGFGVWLTVRSAAIIDIFELGGVRQLHATSEAPSRPQEFKTIGPYGWVRHPIYSGWFLVVFAAPTMTATRLAFAAISSVYLLIAIPFEERSLRRSAGEAYGRYTRDVRWKLVPGLY